MQTCTEPRIRASESDYERRNAALWVVGRLSVTEACNGPPVASEGYLLVWQTMERTRTDSHCVDFVNRTLSRVRRACSGIVVCGRRPKEV